MNRRFRRRVPAFCCLLLLAVSEPAAAAGGGSDYLEPADRKALAGISADPWKVGPLPVPEFSAVVASQRYPNLYWAIRDASKGRDTITQDLDGADCGYALLMTEPGKVPTPEEARCANRRNRARTQLWAFRLVNGRLVSWNAGLYGVEPTNPYFRRFTLPRRSLDAPAYDLHPDYERWADEPNQLMNNDWESLALNPRTGNLSIGATGTFSSPTPLCETRRLIDLAEPPPDDPANEWRPTRIRDLPNYSPTARTAVPRASSGSAARPPPRASSTSW